MHKWPLYRICAFGTKKVGFFSSANAQGFFNGKKINRLQVFPWEKPVVLGHKELRWTIIQRGDQFGLRLRDLNHPNLKSFEWVDTYPIVFNYKEKDKLTPTLNKKIPLANFLRQTSDQDVWEICSLKLKAISLVFKYLTKDTMSFFWFLVTWPMKKTPTIMEDF